MTAIPIWRAAQIIDRLNRGVAPAQDQKAAAGLLEELLGLPHDRRVGRRESAVQQGLAIAAYVLAQGEPRGAAVEAAMRDLGAARATVYAALKKNKLPPAAQLNFSTSAPIVTITSPN
jgi:hypothetical protein